MAKSSKVLSTFIVPSVDKRSYQAFTQDTKEGSEATSGPIAC